jgi:hypothetical protein
VQPGREPGASFTGALAAFALSAGIAGWLFLIPTWGFSSLAAPFGLAAAVPGFWSARKLVAALGLVLNTLLGVVLLDWWTVVDVLPGVPTD